MRYLLVSLVLAKNFSSRVLSSDALPQESKVCPICGFTGRMIKGKGHMACHGRQIPAAFACDRCDYSCEKKDGLVRHMTVHGG